MNLVLLLIVAGVALYLCTPVVRRFRRKKKNSNPERENALLASTMGFPVNLVLVNDGPKVTISFDAVRGRYIIRCTQLKLDAEAQTPDQAFELVEKKHDVRYYIYPQTIFAPGSQENF